jgi:uncharacterized membrane protein YqaE (UPF0057 family)
MIGAFGFPAQRRCAMTLVDILLAFLLPPLVVGLRTGSVKKVLLAIVLMLLGHIPAIIYALYVISHTDRHVVGPAA